LHVVEIMMCSLVKIVLWLHLAYSFLILQAATRPRHLLSKLYIFQLFKVGLFIIPFGQLRVIFFDFQPNMNRV